MDNAPWRHITSRVPGSFLARTPIRDRKALAAVALPAVRRTVVDKRKQYDRVLASSRLFSHHVRARGAQGDAKKFVDVHSPACYIWDPELDARGKGRSRASSAPA